MTFSQVNMSNFVADGATEGIRQREGEAWGCIAPQEAGHYHRSLLERCSGR